MALTINTNVASIRSNRAIEATQRELSRAVQRISSGIKLNSAKDDPAGLATADRLAVQIRGISMAIRNANDGITLARTAEGALQEVTSILQRIQELAVQASNPSNSVSTRASLQGEVAQLNGEITRIAEETEFNGKKLLSGDVVSANFQIGTRPEQTIKLSIAAAGSSNLGNYAVTTNNTSERSISAARIGGFQGEAPGNFMENQLLTIRGFNSNLAAPIISLESEETAFSIVTKINAVEDQTGVLASAETEATLSEIYDAGEAGTQNISFRLYGTNAKKGADISTASLITAGITDSNEAGLRPLITAINAEENNTGITATFVSDNTIKLTNTNGANISIEAFANTALPGEGDKLLVTGAENTTQVTLIEGSDEDSVTIGGVITLNSPKPFSVSTDKTAEEGSLFSNETSGEAQASRFSALVSIDISSIEGAAAAIRISSSALEQVTALRGDLGSIQNRFESTISNLESIRENTETSRSQIIDTDFAEEVSRFTRAQILQQAGIAILAQANAAPFAVLELLRA